MNKKITRVKTKANRPEDNKRLVAGKVLVNQNLTNKRSLQYMNGDRLERARAGNRASTNQRLKELDAIAATNGAQNWTRFTTQILHACRRGEDVHIIAPSRMPIKAAKVLPPDNIHPPDGDDDFSDDWGSD